MIDKNSLIHQLRYPPKNVVVICMKDNRFSCQNSSKLFDDPSVFASAARIDGNFPVSHGDDGSGDFFRNDAQQLLVRCVMDDVHFRSKLQEQPFPRLFAESRYRSEERRVGKEWK